MILSRCYSLSTLLAGSNKLRTLADVSPATALPCITNLQVRFFTFASNIFSLSTYFHFHFQYIFTFNIFSLSICSFHPTLEMCSSHLTR